VKRTFVEVKEEKCVVTRSRAVSDSFCVQCYDTDGSTTVSEDEEQFEDDRHDSDVPHCEPARWVDRQAATTPGFLATAPTKSMDHSLASMQQGGAHEPTTVMLRNLPNNIKRDQLLQMLDSAGFAAKYNFVYLPMDFDKKSSLGYAFLNMNSGVFAKEIIEQLNGTRPWIRSSSHKMLTVCLSVCIRGLPKLVDRYRNSRVMHHDVPDEFKPFILENGLPVEFPRNTKRVRQPVRGRRG